MDIKFSIFISSTFEDLAEERQQAVNAIMSAGHFPVGMEIFKAGDEPPLETIKEYMENTDIFLLILGGLYGSVEDKEQKSFTQMEYEHAVKVLKKQVIPLVLQDKYLHEKEKKTGLNMFESNNIGLYKAFKELIMKNHTIKKINCLEDVTREVTSAIHKFENKDIGGWQRVHPKTSKLSRVGIINLYHPEALREWQERPDFRGAEQIKILFTSGAKFFRELQESLREALADGAIVQILLATPDSDFVKEIEAMQKNPSKGSRTFNNISREIEEVKETLRFLCEDIPGSQLYIGHFNTQYRGNITIIDDKVVFYNPVLAPRPSARLITVKAEGFMLDDCIVHFDTLYRLLDEQGKVQLAFQ